jgi:Fic family protein
MAKSLIEKPPFNFTNALFEKKFLDLDYLNKYKEIDEKGRYLYWSDFKYRVKDGDDAKKAWFAVKFARLSKIKKTSLLNKDNEPFNFCLPDTLDAKLFKITNLANLGIVPHNSIKEKYLISSLIMEEAISSSQLEGASTTRKIAKEMLSSNKKPRNEDEQMILNNYILMKEITKYKDEDLTIDLILHLHKIATDNLFSNGNIAGEFRKSNKIVIADNDGNILHQPPNFKDLPQRLQKLCDFANTNHSAEDGTLFIHPVVKAIILHFMIGYEHPFVDGNGRTARALFYWFMLKSGFDYFKYLSISKLLKASPKKYSLSYLYSEIDDNDLTYFISYQIEIILKAINELMEYLQRKSKEFEEIERLLNGTKWSKKLNFIQKDIIKKAIKNPGKIFTALEIASKYNISPTTARKYLAQLAQYKLLANFKDGKTIAFIAPASLQDMLSY